MFWGSKKVILYHFPISKYKSNVCVFESGRWKVDDGVNNLYSLSLRDLFDRRWGHYFFSSNWFVWLSDNGYHFYRQVIVI